MRPPCTKEHTISQKQTTLPSDSYSVLVIMGLGLKQLSAGSEIFHLTFPVSSAHLCDAHKFTIRALMPKNLQPLATTTDKKSPCIITHIQKQHSSLSTPRVCVVTGVATTFSHHGGKKNPTGTPKKPSSVKGGRSWPEYRGGVIAWGMCAESPCPGRLSSHSRKDFKLI